MFNTFSEAYKNLLSTCYYNPDYESAPRGQRIKELLDATFTIIDPTSNLFEAPSRSSPKKYIAQELMLYFSQETRVEPFARAASLWSKIANENGTINSSYGHLIFNDCKFPSQFNWVIDSLKKDKDSRQAIMHYNRVEHQWEGNKDFPCTMYAQFFIRENKLMCLVYMRSNDAWFGIPSDIPFFTLVHQMVRNELLKTYHDLVLGTYTHKVGSFHIYERDFKKVETLLYEDIYASQIPFDGIKDPIYMAKEAKKFINGDRSNSSPFFQWIAKHHPGV